MRQRSMFEGGCALSETGYIVLDASMTEARAGVGVDPHNPYDPKCDQITARTCYSWCGPRRDMDRIAFTAVCKRGTDISAITP